MNIGVDSVYFIQCGDNGPIKIGHTSIGSLRINSIQYWSPYPVKLLASFVGGRSAEQWLHNRFKKNRIHGEWFNPSPKILAFIEGVRKNPDKVVTPEFCAEFDKKKYVGNLDFILEKLKITPKELSEKIGITQACIFHSRYKNSRYSGKRVPGVPPSPSTIHRILKYADSVGVQLTPENFVRPIARRGRA